MRAANRNGNSATLSVAVCCTSCMQTTVISLSTSSLYSDFDNFSGTVLTHHIIVHCDGAHLQMTGDQLRYLARVHWLMCVQSVKNACQEKEKWASCAPCSTSKWCQYSLKEKGHQAVMIGLATNNFRFHPEFRRLVCHTLNSMSYGALYFRESAKANRIFLLSDSEPVV